MNKLLGVLAMIPGIIIIILLAGIGGDSAKTLKQTIIDGLIIVGFFLGIIVSFSGFLWGISQII